MSKPIRWGGDDPYTHMLIVGPTRCGKTATVIKPLIYQLLLQKKRGIPLGLSVVEPKGDLAAMVNEMCIEMDIPVTHVDPMKEDSARFNPMEGDINDVAEATVVVLQGLFGEQDAFFETVQELSARNVTKLLKQLYGNKMDIVDVMNTLRDQNLLEQRVAELKERDGVTDLVNFFESELLGSMRDKYRQHVIGLRAQLENIVSNDKLRRIMTGESSISIDKHFSEGGVLAVNTALGALRTSGDAFGQFLIMHLQNGTFRRKGTEKTRIPHFLIIDEYSRYINPDVEIFLSLAAEYRVSGIFATQSLGQLEIESGEVSARAMKRSILASCRNKIAFGGLTMEDAKEFSEEFGKDKIIMRQSTYKNKILHPNILPESYRDTEDDEYRFDPTDIKDGIPRFHYIHQLVQEGTPQKPGLAKGNFVRRDWKEAKEWEKGKKRKKFNFLLPRRKKREKEEEEKNYDGLEAITEEHMNQVDEQEEIAESIPTENETEIKLATLERTEEEQKEQEEQQENNFEQESEQKKEQTQTVTVKPPEPKKKEKVQQKASESISKEVPKKKEEPQIKKDDDFWSWS